LKVKDDTLPTTLQQRRLKLTIVSPFEVSPPLFLGDQTFLRATHFVGGPSAPTALAGPRGTM
jgi:hypothetical protein